MAAFYANEQFQGINNAGVVVNLVGLGTAWTGSPFSVSGVAGVSITAQSVSSGTAAQITLTIGSTAGTLTITDSISGQTTILVITAVSWVSESSTDFSAASPTSVGAAGTTTGSGGPLTDELGNVWQILLKSLIKIAITSGGTGYTPSSSSVVLTFAGTYTTAPSATCTTDGSGTVTAVNLTNCGSNITSISSITPAGGGSGFTFSLTFSGNLFRSVTGAVGSTAPYTTQADRAAGSLSQRNEVEFYNVGGTSVNDQLRINNAAHQMYSVNGGTGNIRIFYLNNGASTGKGATITAPPMVAGDRIRYGFCAIPGTTTGTQLIGIFTNLTQCSVLGIITADNDTSTGVQTAGNNGVSVGASGGTPAISSFKTFVPGGFTINPTSAAFHVNPLTVLAHQFGTNWTGGSSWTVSGGNAVLNSSTDIDGSNFSLSINTGAPTATPAVPISVTITDITNSTTQTLTLNPLAVGAGTAEPNADGTITITSAAPTFYSGTPTIQWYRSTDPTFTPGGGTTLSGKTTFTAIDTPPASVLPYYYKAVISDVSQTVTTLAIPGTPIGPTVPSLSLGFLGDSTTQGVTGTTAEFGSGCIGELIPSAGGSGYATPPTLSVSAPTGVTSAAVAASLIVGGKVVAGSMTNQGAGYGPQLAPQVIVTGDGTLCTAHAVLNSSGGVTNVIIDTSSADWTTATFTFAPTAKAVAVLSGGSVGYSYCTFPGSGYVTGVTPTVTPSGGGGSGAAFFANTTGGAPLATQRILKGVYGIRRIDMVNCGGSGLTAANWLPAQARFQGFVAQFGAPAANKFIHIRLGTNDSKVPAVSGATYYANMLSILTSLLTTGYQVIVSVCPYINVSVLTGSFAGVWDDTSDAALVNYNTVQVPNVIAAVNALGLTGKAYLGDTQAYAYFAEFPQLLFDGVHGNDFGQEATASMWSVAITRIANISSSSVVLRLYQAVK